MKLPTFDIEEEFLVFVSGCLWYSMKQVGDSCCGFSGS